MSPRQAGDFVYLRADSSVDFGTYYRWVVTTAGGVQNADGTASFVAHGNQVGVPHDQPGEYIIRTAKKVELIFSRFSGDNFHPA